MFTKDQLLLLAMCLVPNPLEGDLTMQAIRNRFMARDRQWNEADALAEYRWQYAKAIIHRWEAS